MNKGLYISRKNYLYSLIKKTANYCGERDMDLVKQHFVEVLESYPDDKIEESIACYTYMIEELKGF